MTRKSTINERSVKGPIGKTVIMGTESIAVGSKVFIEATQKMLGIKAKGRKIVGSKKSYELRESAIPYGGNFASENGLLRLQNIYFWHDID